MDSRTAEDTMLPLDLNGSSNIYKLSDISGDEGHLPSAVGDIAKDRLSVLRARTMKDFEKQITELKKENFNLKLRIYFLEEQIQQKFDGAIEDIYKNNIELKVEVESLKHELQEKQNLLIKAFKAVESLAGDKDSKIHSIKEDAQKQLQQMEDFLSSKIHALEEDLKISQAKVESLSNLLEERAQAIDIGHSAISEIYQKDLEVNSVLEEKDRMIKQLNFALETKESLINQLEEEKAQSKLCTGSCAEGKLRKSVDGLQEKDEELKMLNENQKQLADPEASLSQVFEELEKAKVMVLSLQERLEEADQTNYTEELNQQIEELNLSLSQAREVVHKVQILKFKGVEYYKNLLMEKETLLADLHIDNMAKDTEIHKLSAVMKKRDQELSDLQQEKERLEKELDEDRKQSEYDELICTLRKEQQIYFTLIESVKDSDSINSLQIELNKICSLRKQLEEDVLANRNLRKMLETQIKATRNKEGDTFSFCGDQTSYMSICLRDHSQINEETEKQSLQELQKKINNKSRLPIPIKSYRSFIKQSMSTDLQHQRAEEELQVYKMQNKEFQEKLDLSELVIKI
ncbi:CDK5 regulatory subunit-associated protein 2 [Microcaecilia unicolor]|uniref:CDK5 regulatory subunit-associated protein 2 n=1 Tax=Microcaecilia unicolor TaxID=1415580 RepID=A0A6P7YGV7_9AMPH|nr:CDK5 regulatory subunit-associated protein 2-like [Microcaecilia unicolor]